MKQYSVSGNLILELLSVLIK